MLAFSIIKVKILNMAGVDEVSCVLAKILYSLSTKNHPNYYYPIIR